MSAFACSMDGRHNWLFSSWRRAERPWGFQSHLPAGAVHPAWTSAWKVSTLQCAPRCHEPRNGSTARPTGGHSATPGWPAEVPLGSVAAWLGRFRNDREQLWDLWRSAWRLTTSMWSPRSVSQRSGLPRPASLLTSRLDCRSWLGTQRGLLKTPTL